MIEKAEAQARMKAVAMQVADFTQLGVSYGVTLATATVILIAGYIISGWVSRALRARLERLENFDATLIPVLSQIVRYVILVFTLILVLAEFGIQTTSIIAVLGAAGLAIGLALQGTLQNVASGMMLLFLRPLQTGDFVEAAGTSGTVREIGLFMTVLHTSQNLFVAVPNSKIWADTIINYSRLPRRRLDLVVGISYDDDVAPAIEVLRNVVAGDERVFDDPEPQFLTRDLGASSVDIEIRVWTNRQDVLELGSDLRREIKLALELAGISIPYPQDLDLVVGISYDDDVAPAIEVLRNVVAGDERVFDDPEPQFLTRDLGASSVDIEIRVWTNRQDVLELGSDLRREIKLALELAGISIPYPHQRLILTQES